MSKVINFKSNEPLPAHNQHAIAEFLREMADDIDNKRVAELSFCSIIAIRADTGVPIDANRSVGRFLSQLEWAGVLDYLQHQNFEEMKGD